MEQELVTQRLLKRLALMSGSIEKKFYFLSGFKSKESINIPFTFHPQTSVHTGKLFCPNASSPRTVCHVLIWSRTLTSQWPADADLTCPPASKLRHSNLCSSYPPITPACLEHQTQHSHLTGSSPCIYDFEKCFLCEPTKEPTPGNVWKPWNQ